MESIIDKLVDNLDGLVIIPSLFIFFNRQLELFHNPAKRYRDDHNFKILHFL